MKEVWKDIKGYEGLYQISSLGKVKSLSRMIGNGSGIPRLIPERILSQRLGNNGYCYVNLHKNNKSTSTYIHRLVSEYFVLNADNKPCVNHKNGVRHDNRIENLEWVTHSENSLHAYRELGRKTWIEGKTGAKCPNSKPVMQLTKKGKFIKAFPGMHEASRITGVGVMSISDVCRGKRKASRKNKWISLRYDGSYNEEFNYLLSGSFNFIGDIIA